MTMRQVLERTTQFILPNNGGVLTVVKKDNKFCQWEVAYRGELRFCECGERRKGKS